MRENEGKKEKEEENRGLKKRGGFIRENRAF
jgi:hypothetical protein